MASATNPTYGRDHIGATDTHLRTTAPAAVRRISWGAIIAGIVVVLIVQLIMMLLGLAIGASTIDPLAGDTPQASTLGIGSAIWGLLTTAASVFAGAWVAGRLAGMPTRTDGLLHGVVTWAAATLIAFYVLTSTAGSLLGGAFGALGNVAQTLGQGGQTLAQGAMQVLPDEIRTQAEQLFEQAPQAQGQIQQEAQQAQQATGATNMWDAVQRVVRGVQEGAAPQDRQAAINVISQQAGIPPQEAEQRLNQFQQTYQEYTQQATQQAREAADAAASTVASVSFWSVLGLLIGAALAAAGGSMGTPRDLRAAV